VRLAPHPLIYDWNHDAAAPRAVAMLDDETLRDGLQSPSVRTPTIDEKIELLTHMDGLGSTPPTSACPAPARGSRATSNASRVRSPTAGCASAPTAPRGR
jgi:hypothetical protein